MAFFPRFRSGDFFFLLLGLVVLSGCATPKAVVKNPEALGTYRKVYLTWMDEDPRNVHPRVASRLRQSGFEVVELHPDSPPIESQGSGFVVSPDGHVLTCAHVLGSHSNATAWIQGTRHVGRVVATDTNLDLALIKFDGHDGGAFRPLPFAAQTTYQMGQDVFTMSFPLAEVLGVSPRLNKGLVSAAVGYEDNTDQLQISAEVQPGSSGGPLLNGSGEAIGMIIGTLNPMNVMVRTGGSLPQNVNFAVQAKPIRTFLRESGVATSDAPAEAQSPAVFDEAAKSLALIRAGIVEEKDLRQPALFCAYVYQSLWDVWFRFRIFHIEFYDLRTGDLVLKAGQYADNMFSSENGVLDRTFEEICAKFFPDSSNPFQGKKDKPKPEPQ